MLGSNQQAGNEPGIIFEDEDFLALSKPAGWQVFPRQEEATPAASSWLCDRYPEFGSVGPPDAPAFVHRLDGGTSGVLLAARNQLAYDSMREAFHLGKVRKEYLALVEGDLREPATIDLPLGGRYRRSQRVMVQGPNSKLRWCRPARTAVHPLSSVGSLTLCRVQIATGVRHQIRVHLSHLGHPIAGDLLYGALRHFPMLEDRFFLHASLLEFHHPSQQRAVVIESQLPAELVNVLNELGLDFASCIF